MILFLTQLINLYSLLIFIYVILSYFPDINNTKLYELLAQTCEPFLRIFSFARIGNISFAPPIAIFVLQIVNQMLGIIYY